MDKEVLEKANELMRQIEMLEQTIEDAKIVKNNADGKARVGIQIGNIRYMYVRPYILRHVMDLIVDMESRELLRVKKEFDKL